MDHLTSIKLVNQKPKYTMRAREFMKEGRIVFHASSEPFSTFDASKTRDGAFHFGTEAQAKSRSTSNNAPHIYSYEITVNNPIRMRDDGGFWGSKIDKAKGMGHDGIVYLNRYENITPDQLRKARHIGKGDERNLTDKEFLKIAPQAEDSYIVFKPEQIHPLDIKSIDEAVKTDKIDALIKRAGYSNDEIEDATSGLCGTFALALYRYLKRNGVSAQLVLFSEDDDEENNANLPKGYEWRHVAVKVGDRYYDIRGHVTPEEIHKEFYTTQITPVSEESVIKELRKVNKEDARYTKMWAEPRAYSNKRLRDWRGRLKENVLKELFNQPFSFSWKQKTPDYWRAVFDVDGREYSAICNKEREYFDSKTNTDISDIWELYFIPTDNAFDTGAIGVSEPSKVFATALAAFRQFIEQIKPSMIQFTADARQPSRVKLYKKMANTFSEYLISHDYEPCEPPKHRNIPSNDYFTLTFKKRGIDNEE